MNTMNALLAVSVLSLVALCYGRDQIMTTFGQDFNPHHSMPSSVDEAETDGWTELEAEDGYKRYWDENKDHNRIALFNDDNGEIAGFQLLHKKEGYEFNRFCLTSTAGGVDYCSQKVIFLEDGGIELPSFADPTKTVQIPFYESELDRSASTWGNGKCFPGMGQHYFFNQHTTTPKADVYPYQLLYNNGELEGFVLFYHGYPDSPSDVVEDTHGNIEGIIFCCLEREGLSKEMVEFSKEVTSLHVFLRAGSVETRQCPK